jgi:hypothetical protein
MTGRIVGGRFNNRHHGDLAAFGWWRQTSGVIDFGGIDLSPARGTHS